MVTVDTEAEMIAWRCWDGDEMEYEFFTFQEVFKQFDSGCSNYEIAAQTGAPLGGALDGALQQLRKIREG